MNIEGLSGGKRLLALILAICVITAGAMVLLPQSGAAIQPSPVVFNRIMTSNPSACFSVDGAFYDWIELVNTGDAPVDLTGWKLADKLDLRGAYIFLGGVLEPGATLIVYCASRPEGYQGSEIFTGFRLSADGESLMLSDPMEAQVQALKVPAMKAAWVYCRDGETGEYTAQSYFDTVEGTEDGVELNPPFTAKSVMISELMPANGAILADEDGDYSDWIELYNGTDEAVDLEGWAISDDDADRRKWVFPAVSLQPGAYMVVFASGKDRDEPTAPLHTNFKLSSAGETVRLYTARGSVASWAKYEASKEDASVARQPNGVMQGGSMPSPGYENTASGTRLALGDAFGTLSQNQEGLYINEVLCSGSGEDWVEIVNTSALDVDLSGMGLSDNPKRPRRWQFPAGSSLRAGGYALVALTGKGGASGGSGDRYSADFALSSGETVVLARPDGMPVDSVRLLDQYRGISYGRADGQPGYRYFTKPTPGAANGSQSYAQRAEAVRFSVPGGLQQGASVSLELSAEQDMTIYYTTDGTEPTVQSKVYQGPLNLAENTVVKAVAWRSDALQSPTAAHTYIFGVDHSLRLVCVSGTESALNGPNGTLNTGVKGSGCPVYMEVYEPDGTQLIGQNCLLKLAGHGSRTDFPQKGFSLRAKAEYGDSKFRAALFSKRPYTEYKSVFMRASGQDNKQTHMRDSILSALAADTTVMYQETEPSVVYVNGQYWGQYNMRERVSAKSIAQREGWENADDVVILEGEENHLMAVQGSIKSYNSLMAQVKKLDFTSDEVVEQLKKYVDVENYLDYVALQIYTANQDLNNIRLYNNPKAGGRWRWIFFDQDLSFQVDANSISRWLTPGGVGSITSQDNTLFIQLMKNAGVRDYFLTRMGQLLATTFSTEHVTAMIRERYDVIQPEMALNCKRWGWSMKTWRKYGQAMLDYAESRPRKLIGYFRETMKLSDGDVQRYFGDALAKIGG